MIDTLKYAEEFWENGYLHLKGFFSIEKMNVLNSLCLEHFGLNPKWEHNEEFLAKSNCEIIPWFPIREDGVKEFESINDHQLFNKITQEILGEGWNVLYCMSMFSKKGTAGQAWHQDSPPEDRTKFNLNRLVYTHNITDETGGQVVFVPKSHKLGEITKGDPMEEMDNQLVLSPEVGDLVILHGHCWHRVLLVTGKYRISTNFRAMPKGTPKEITDTAVYRNMRYYFPTNEVLVER